MHSSIGLSPSVPEFHRLNHPRSVSRSRTITAGSDSPTSGVLACHCAIDGRIIGISAMKESGWSTDDASFADHQHACGAQCVWALASSRSTSTSR